MTVVRFHADGFGVVQAPPRPWSYPSSRLVRLQLVGRCRDWSADALDAAANICEGSDVMVEGDDPVLAAEFSCALWRRLSQMRGGDAA